METIRKTFPWRRTFPYAQQGTRFGAAGDCVRYRTLLSHIGYKKLDLSYVHPSWDHEGAAVTELDLGFLPKDERLSQVDASLIVRFLEGYYSALPNKPAAWLEMIEQLKKVKSVQLLPL